MSQSDILRYQRHRSLADCPAYHAGLQLALADGQHVYLALAPTEFAIYRQQPDQAFHYDLEARLTKVAHPDQFWRRSLSHRIVHTRKHPEHDGGGISRALLDPSEADRITANAHDLASAVYHALTTDKAHIEFGKPSADIALNAVTPFLARAAQFDVVSARADAERYRRLYRSVAVLPPNEYNAVVLQATEGCVYNQCSFCNLYRDARYRAKTADEFAHHVSDVLNYHGGALRARRSIFLGEANALMIPHDQLVADLRALNTLVKLPPPDEIHIPAKWWLGQPRQFDGIGSFMDVFATKPRSATQYEELRQLGLRRVYIGMESGDAGLLAFLRKPIEPDHLVATVAALKKAGIHIGVIILLGAGGKQFHQQHITESARVLNCLPLDSHDYIFLSPLVVYDGGAYDAAAMTRQIEPLTPAEIQQQDTAIRQRLKFEAQRGHPYVARYELETFAY